MSKAFIDEQTAADTATFTVKLNSIPNGTALVNISSDNAAAEVSAPGKAQAASIQLSFSAADWQTAQTVTVHPVDNATKDGNANVTINIAPDAASTDTTGYATAPAAPQTITVVDNEAQVIIFRTATHFTGNLVSGTGTTYADARTAADALVAAEAPVACGGLTVKGLLAISAADQIIDMPTNHGVPANYRIITPTGGRAAIDWPDLLDGQIEGFSNFKALGIGGSTAMYHWTGSFGSGAVQTHTCSGWTSNATNGGIGTNTGFNNAFGTTSEVNMACTNANPLLGICY